MPQNDDDATVRGLLQVGDIVAVPGGAFRVERITCSRELAKVTPADDGRQGKITIAGRIVIV